MYSDYTHHVYPLLNHRYADMPKINYYRIGLKQTGIKRNWDPELELKLAQYNKEP